MLMAIHKIPLTIDREGEVIIHMSRGRQGKVGSC